MRGLRQLTEGFSPVSHQAQFQFGSFVHAGATARRVFGYMLVLFVPALVRAVVA